MKWRDRMLPRAMPGPWFFVILIAVGIVGTLFLFVRPAWHWLETQSWVRTPCVVETSEVRKNRSKRGRSTYRVDIRYAYEFQGSSYIGDTYDVSIGSTSGHSGKRQVVEAHPPGYSTFCHVNPADPSRAVLSQRFPGTVWFGLVPLIFSGFGLAGLLTRKARTRV